jgi:hypothetical protein
MGIHDVLPGLIVDPDVLSGLSHDEAEWAPVGSAAGALRPSTVEGFRGRYARAPRPGCRW